MDVFLDEEHSGLLLQPPQLCYHVECERGCRQPVQVCVFRCAWHTFSGFRPCSALFLSPPSSSSYWLLFRTHAAVLSTGDIAIASTGELT